MKFLNTKINLAGMTAFLLVIASLLGFSSVMSTAAASLSIDETSTNTTTATEDNGDTSTATDNMSLYANATTIPTVELAEEPFAVGHYREVSNMTDETQEQFSFEENTTITLPGTTQTITTRDTGQGTFILLPGGGSGTVHFSTNSTGILAPLNNTIAVFLDEVQLNEDSIVRFYEWKSDGSGGAPIGSVNNSTTTN